MRFYSVCHYRPIEWANLIDLIGRRSNLGFCLHQPGQCSWTQLKMPRSLSAAKNFYTFFIKEFFWPKFSHCSVCIAIRAVGKREKLCFISFYLFYEKLNSIFIDLPWIESQVCQCFPITFLASQPSVALRNIPYPNTHSNQDALRQNS